MTFRFKDGISIDWPARERVRSATMKKQTMIRIRLRAERYVEHDEDSGGSSSWVGPTTEEFEDACRNAFFYGGQPGNDEENVIESVEHFKMRGSVLIPRDRVAQFLSTIHEEIESEEDGEEEVEVTR